MWRGSLQNSSLGRQVWNPAQSGQFHLNSPQPHPVLDKEQPDRKLLQKVNKFLLEKDWMHTGWWQGQGQSLADF